MCGLCAVEGVVSDMRMYILAVGCGGPGPWWCVTGSLLQCLLCS